MEGAFMKLVLTSFLLFAVGAVVAGTPLNIPF